MSCTSPIYALDLGVKEDGKRAIKILPKRFDLSSIHQLEYRYGKNNVLPLPCGSCLSCRLAKAREWAVRCTLEASLYEDNCFITLTYDDEHMPGDHKLHREHVQDFFKKLRHYTQFRYFGCGEYSPAKRPHYHLILFNYYPDDVDKFKSSALIRKLWPYGFNYVEDCTFGTCQYVARYTTKKVYSDEKTDEFLMMSLKPGIGAGWFAKHFDIFEADKICGSFGVSAIPRYFEKLADLVCIDLQDVKQKRIDKAADIKLHELIVHSMEHQEDLYAYKAAIKSHDFAKKGALRKNL